MKTFPEVSLLLMVHMSHEERGVTDIAGRVCRLVTGNRLLAFNLKSWKWFWQPETKCHFYKDAFGREPHPENDSGKVVLCRWQRQWEVLQSGGFSLLLLLLLLRSRKFHTRLPKQTVKDTLVIGGKSKKVVLKCLPKDVFTLDSSIKI